MITKNKNFYFCCSLPRSGNTLLGSLLNNSNEVRLSPNSVLPFVFENLSNLKHIETFKNFPYHIGVDNIAKNIFNLYYQYINVPNIIDNGPWGTPFNLSIIRQLFNKRKFIVITRPVLECLASFIKIEKVKNVEKRCDELMLKEGRLGKAIWSIQNLKKEKENYMSLTYDEIINNTETSINKIFNFLNIDEEFVNNKNIKQYSLDDVTYDDTCLNGNLHKLRIDKIEKVKYKAEDYLPSNTINKYKDITL